MPTIVIPEATYQRLIRRAAVLHTTVEELALPALEEASQESNLVTASTGKLMPEEWQAQFDKWQLSLRAIAYRYPPSFEADVSRQGSGVAPAEPVSEPPVDLPFDEWKKALDEVVARAKEREHRYPPGFEADVSTESIYEGCGE